MLPYKVTICGLSELSEVVPSGISHVISILDPDYPYPSELKIIDSSRRELFSFEDVVVPEESQKIPERADIKRLLDWGRGLLLGGEETHLLVHCHAGVSRSTAATAILMLGQNPCLEEQVFQEISRLRPRNWPNSRMVEIADELLGCQGRFIAELKRHHARTVVQNPELAELIRLHGRAHEVPD